MPGRSSACRNAIAANPTPPAAPAPGAPATPMARGGPSCSTAPMSPWVAVAMAARRDSADSSVLTSSSVAPFWGP